MFLCLECIALCYELCNKVIAVIIIVTIAWGTSILDTPKYCIACVIHSYSIHVPVLEYDVIANKEACDLHRAVPVVMVALV